jgi:hypothetical protein
VSGCGTIFERAIVESPVVVGFENDVPYACLLVELEEQPDLLIAGNLVDAAPPGSAGASSSRSMTSPMGSACRSSGSWRTTRDDGAAAEASRDRRGRLLGRLAAQ